MDTVWLLPKQDIEGLVNSYQTNDHNGLGMNADQFLIKIGTNFLVEWAYSDRPSYIPIGGGEDFSGHISRETHYHLVRNGYNWNEDMNRFEGNNHEPITDEVYQKNRQEVIHLLANQEYNGQSFTDYINKITHSAIDDAERYPWSEERCVFVGGGELPIPKDVYQEKRQRVVDAFVRWAIHYFSEVEEKLDPKIEWPTFDGLRSRIFS